jgi:SMC interacting uncharacterized protein involved in chromosome segregation
MKLIALFAFLFLSLLPLNDAMEEELSIAFNYAKKGVYYGLSNLKGLKTKLEDKLVENNKLQSMVKVSKEINGVRIESTGYYESTTLTVILYRSYDGLIKDGYLSK